MYSITDVCYIMASDLCHLLLWFNSLNPMDHNVTRMQVRNKVSCSEIDSWHSMCTVCTTLYIHMYLFLQAVFYRLHFWPVIELSFLLSVILRLLICVKWDLVWMFCDYFNVCEVLVLVTHWKKNPSSFIYLQVLQLSNKYRLSAVLV